MSIITPRYIFHHIPKTGGRWLEGRFVELGMFERLDPPMRADFGEFPMIFAVAGKMGGRHVPYKGEGKPRVAIVREKESWYGSLWRFREDCREPSLQMTHYSWGRHEMDVCEGGYEEFRECMGNYTPEGFYESLMAEYEPYTDIWWPMERLEEVLEWQ